MLERTDDRPHAPVLVDAVTGFLAGRATVVDMTLGAGGHAEALLRAGVERVIGVDRDPRRCRSPRSASRPSATACSLIRSTFAAVEVDGPVDGVLYDLGVSSMQLDRAGARLRLPAGRTAGHADGRRTGPSAADLVNELPEEELANVIFEFGGEHRSRRIARAIVRARERSPIETTDALARVVAGALGRRPGGPHPARRTFQALRIAVNRELEELAASLPQAVELLAPGGRVVVLAYHSLEDRIVKRTFLEDERLLRLTKKPVMPGEDEIAANPRARSARLRAAERVEVAA